MAFGDYATNGASVAAGAVSTYTLSFPANTTSGNSAVLAVRVASDAVTITQVKDSNNVVWTNDVASFEQAANSGNLSFWRGSNLAPTASVTITLGSADTALRLVLEEYVGNFADSPTTHTGTGTNGSADSGAVVTSVSTCVIAAIESGGDFNSGWTAGTGYTKRHDVLAGSALKLGIEDRNGAQAASTYNGTATISGTNEPWAALIAAYSNAASAATTSFPYGRPLLGVGR